MPLLILGLLLISGLLAYSIVRYINSGEEDTRSVRERYPHAFPVVVSKDKNTSSSAADGPDEAVDAESYVDSDSFRGDIDYMLRNLKYDVRDKASDLKGKARERGIDVDKIRDILRQSDDNEPDNTVEFPRDNIEAEKRKRNINSD